MEHSLSSLAYKGSISSAIAEAKKGRRLFLVFISGDDEVSRQLESSTWSNSKVAESMSKYCVMLHLSQGSSDATQFSAIFPQNSVPCITAVGYNGVQLWQHEGFITADDLGSTLEKLWLSLHIQDTTAAVLSAAFASKTAEPSGSGASASVSVPERSLNASVGSPSAEKHGEPLEAAVNMNSEKAKEERTDACAVEDEAREFGGSPSSNSVEAVDKEFSESEISDPSIPAVKEVSHSAPDMASRAIEDSHSSEQANGNFDGQSKTVETNTAVQDFNHETVEAKQSAVLTDLILNIRMSNGVKLQEKFSVTSTLKAVKDYVDEHEGLAMGPYDLAIPYPRKVYNDQDLGRSLSELGLLNRQALIMVPRQRATDKPNSRTVITDTNESDGGYFSYVKRMVSYINPLSYLWSGPGSTSSGQQPQQGPNSTLQTPRQIPSESRNFRDGRANTTSGRSIRPASRVGSNIHTLKRDEDDGQFKDSNSYWNGNSTQYGGDDNRK